MMRSRRTPMMILALVGAVGFSAGRWTRPGQVALAEPATAPAAPRQLLTKHENETFENQTVYLSGQAFIHCKFNGCTVVVRESPYHLDGCTFERCNWHVDWLVLWGDEKAIREFKALATMLEAARRDGLKNQTQTR